MDWKYIIVNILLVIPSRYIITSATFENSPGLNERYNTDLSDEEFINKLISELYTGRIAGSNSYAHSDHVDKKDEILNPDEDLDQIDFNPEPQDLGPAPEAGVDRVNVPASGNNKEANVGSSGGKQDSPGPEPVVVHAVGLASALQQQDPTRENESKGSGYLAADDKLFIIVIAAAVSTGFVGLMLAGVCYYKFHKSAKAVSDVEYPAYGVTGPTKERIPSPGDHKLAQSAQMYHYQHQKQQMIAMEKANSDMKHDASDDDSEEDNVEGDYTVYECPGLAPTGEMEVRNPLFRGEETPVSPGQDITGRPHEEQPSNIPGKQ